MPGFASQAVRSPRGIHLESPHAAPTGPAIARITPSACSAEIPFFGFRSERLLDVPTSSQARTQIDLSLGFSQRTRGLAHTSPRPHLTMLPTKHEHAEPNVVPRPGQLRGRIHNLVRGPQYLFGIPLSLAMVSIPFLSLFFSFLLLYPTRSAQASKAHPHNVTQDLTID